MDFLKVSELVVRNGLSAAVCSLGFTMGRGQQLALIGATGSGKTSVLKAIAGLAQLQSGSVWLQGERVLGPEEKLLPGHPEIAYLSQHFELRNHYRVGEVLDYANRLAPADAERLYEAGKIRHLLGRWTTALSGGERQRVSLIRLLLGNPKLLLLDEPFSNLDRPHKNLVSAILREAAEQLGITGILVSHDPDDVLSWADRILVMQEGKLIQDAAPETVYRHPVDPYTAGLLGSYNIVDGQLAAHFPELRREGQRLIVRPEDFSLLSSQDGWAVLHSAYFGSHYEVEMAWMERKLIVRSEVAFAKGDRVEVRLLR